MKHGKPMAIEATYEDIAVRKGRGVAVISLAIPVERFKEFVEMFGGPPGPGETTWVAIARLDKSKSDHKPQMGASERKKRSQVAGALCASDKTFMLWISRKAGIIVDRDDEVTTQQAAESLRYFLNIDSRSQLDTDDAAAVRFDTLLAQYRRAYPS